LSHRRHHRFAGHADRDEAWQPLTEGQYRKLPRGTRLLRYRLALFALPFYLLRGTPSRGGSHFDPASPIFGPGDRPKVLASSLLCLGMLSFLVGLGIALGPVAIARYYLAPYAVFAAWLGLVTLLHHTAPDVPWYRGREWTFLRGALSTVDRRYGWLEGVHHHAGHHVAHHLFPWIPHYRLAEATEAIRPVLGDHYRVSGERIPRALLRALRECRFVPDRGDRVTFRR
jgi:omega-3 fatty acid desaturase (delta-15 desaturase)